MNASDTEKQSTIKVSVCIPTYNYAQYLPEAIESVLKQTYRDFELLIIDDCSTDTSAEIISKYARNDARIVFQINPENVGMVKNWNLCLQRARGEYIKFLFGDDLLSSENALEKMISILDADEQISLVASARNVINEASAVKGLWSGYKGGATYTGAEIIQDCLIEQKNIIGEPSAVMCRKKHAVRGFNERYRQIVDLEMWFHILEQGKFCYIDEPLCSFRMHGRQQTKVNLERIDFDCAESFWLIDDYAKKPYMQLSKLQRGYMSYGPVYSLWKLFKKGKIPRTTALREVKKHTPLIQFFLYYPFYRLYKFGRRTVGL